jgi:hypothetical protein
MYIEVEWSFWRDSIGTWRGVGVVLLILILIGIVRGLLGREGLRLGMRGRRRRHFR